jgi:hypothetical protein
VTEPDDLCPRCGAHRDAAQEYCLECGLRLPPTGGGIARLRRGWVRRIGWYPGDFVWTTLLSFVVAAAGAAAAIAVTGHRTDTNTGTTFAATTPNVPLTAPATTTVSAPTRTTTLPKPPEPTTTAPTKTKTKPKPAKPASALTPWPAGQTGWTVVLESLPNSTTGKTRADARAQQALRAGLPEVGVLDSSRYASLHPGYLVVFAGIYDARQQAQSTLNAALAAGFGSAYVRQIAR